MFCCCEAGDLDTHVNIFCPVRGKEYNGEINGQETKAAFYPRLGCGDAGYSLCYRSDEGSLPIKYFDSDVSVSACTCEFLFSKSTNCGTLVEFMPFVSKGEKSIDITCIPVELLNGNMVYVNSCPEIEEKKLPVEKPFQLLGLIIYMMKKMAVLPKYYMTI